MISNSKSMKNALITILIIWSKNMKAIIGKTKYFTCLIVTPPRKSNSFFSIVTLITIYSNIILAIEMEIVYL